MTRNDIINFGMKKYGKNWIGPLAEEIGYSFSQLWRVSEGESPVTRRLELEMERLIRQQRFERWLSQTCGMSEDQKHG